MCEYAAIAGHGRERTYRKRAEEDGERAEYGEEGARAGQQLPRADNQTEDSGDDRAAK